MPPIRIPVFVVSLPDCAERRETISKTLSNLGVEFEFVDAVDGRQGLDSQYEDQIDRAGVRRAGLILSDADFACALSHLNIYRRIVSGNIAYALVLEDDAIPYPKLVDFLDGGHYRDAELTQLYSSGLRPYVRWGETKELWGGGYIHVLYPSPENDLHRCLYGVVSSCSPLRQTCRSCEYDG